MQTLVPANIIQFTVLLTLQSQSFVLVLKGYCMSSWINCGMAKSLPPAQACEGLLASDLAIPQLIYERVQ